MEESDNDVPVPCPTTQLSQDDPGNDPNLNPNFSLSSELPIKDQTGLWIFGESDSKRRMIFIDKINGSFGFTLQSYGVRYKHGDRETDFITYVNAVDKDGAAEIAGLREGDVILSINEQNMARVEHKSLVNFIRQCPARLKMVVISDERARKVELHMRLVHLQKKLQDKMKELEDLNRQESEILAGVYKKLEKTSNCTSNPSNVNVAETPSGGGDPCLPGGTCCFCPHKKSILAKAMEKVSLGGSGGGGDTGPSTSTRTPKIRSKSVKVSQSEKDKEKQAALFYYECYRKCQSSRELHKEAAMNPGIKSEIPGCSAVTSTSSALSSKPSSSQAQPHQQHHRYSESMIDSMILKPKSWDNLTMTTKSFGGYGFGFGYGYYPYKEGNGGHRGHSHGHVTHPHHHNHHSHCSHSRGGSHYYNVTKGENGSSGGGVHPGGHKTISSHSYSKYSGEAAGSSKSNEPPGGWSKTLPSSTIKCSGPEGGHDHPKFPSSSGLSSVKCERSRTLSDSSLANEQKHKDIHKVVSYFKRSGDNVRFSSDEEYETYAYKEGTVEKEYIFV